VIKRVLLGGLLLWLGEAVAAVGAPESGSVPESELERRLLAMDQVVANFTQQVRDAQGYVTEQASGTLQLAKPNFRWEVLAPFPQIIVAKGGQLAIYDPDLEQVTTKILDESLTQTPLSLLTQAKLDLSVDFDVSRVDSGESAAERIFVLRPRAQDALFQFFEVTFLGDQLQALKIFDHTGQETLIRFTDYQSSQVIQSQVFELEYPPGTDFVRG